MDGLKCFLTWRYTRFAYLAVHVYPKVSPLSDASFASATVIDSPRMYVSVERHKNGPLAHRTTVAHQGSLCVRLQLPTSQVSYDPCCAQPRHKPRLHYSTTPTSSKRANSRFPIASKMEALQPLHSVSYWRCRNCFAKAHAVQLPKLELLLLISQRHRSFAAEYVSNAWCCAEASTRAAVVECCRRAAAAAAYER
jgi:hypothetical protein